MKSNDSVKCSGKSKNFRMEVEMTVSKYYPQN